MAVACATGPLWLLVPPMPTAPYWPPGRSRPRGGRAGRRRLHQGVALGRLEDDVGELLGVVSRPRVLMVSWNCWPLGTGCWPICPAATCTFCWAMAVTTSMAAEVERRQLVGVEPGPQAVVALAEVGDVGHAGQPAQFVLDVDRGVVAQEEAVVAVVRRDQVHDHQRVGRHLLDVDALVLHQWRDDRQGQRDAVLHQHLGHVRVHAQLEGHGQGVGAVVGGLRRHVHHALDAADLLLDGGGHRVAHGLGVGPGIERRHQHRGRRHLGYCATGSVNTATPPASTKTIDSTEAKIGRSMKKWEITCVALRFGPHEGSEAPAAAPSVPAPGPEGCQGSRPYR